MGGIPYSFIYMFNLIIISFNFVLYPVINHAGAHFQKEMKSIKVSHEIFAPIADEALIPFYPPLRWTATNNGNTNN